MKSLKVKLVSIVSAFILALSLLIVGVWAVGQSQTITMEGSVNFNVADKSLYVKDVRMQEDVNSAPYSLKDQDRFMPGYINGNFNMNLGEFTNDYGTFALYFDIINTMDESTSETFAYTVDPPTQPSNGTATITILDINGDAIDRIPQGTVKPSQISDSTQASATIKLTIASTSSTQVDLSEITITINQVEPKEILEGFIFDDSGNLTSYTGTDSEVTVPSSYSMIGEPTTKSLYFENFDSTNEYMMTLINITNFRLTTDGGEEYIFDDFGEVVVSSNYESYFPCTIEYKDYSNVTFTTGSDYQVEGVVGAFAFNQTIQTVNLPDSIKNIGLYSFASSTLKELTLPSSLTSIGSNAFRDCSGLTGKLNLGECTSLTSIGDRAFRDCSGLTSLTLPSSLTSIGDYAFNYCSGLTSVDLSGCTSLTSIGIWAFRDCSGLKSVDLRGCTSLTSIEDDAFYGCTKLTSVDLSGCTSLTSIGIWAFYGCSGLTSISLPSSLTSIGSSAFRDCRGLTSLDLSGCTSLTRIESYAFEGCSALTSVTFGNTSGWYVTQDASATSGKEVDVSLPSTNASNLTGQYSDYYWKRNV